MRAVPWGVPRASARPSATSVTRDPLSLALCSVYIHIHAPPPQD